MDIPKWYLGGLVAQKLVLCQWFQFSYNQGCPPVEFACCGGSKTRTLYRKFPMVQSLLESGMSPSRIWVLWWLNDPYFESQIPNCSRSHTVRDFS